MPAVTVTMRRAGGCTAELAAELAVRTLLVAALL